MTEKFLCHVSFLGRILLLVAMMPCFSGITFAALVQRDLAVAVYEHKPVGDPRTDGPVELMRKNTAVYQSAAKRAASEGAELILFPGKAIGFIFLKQISILFSGKGIMFIFH